LTMPREAETREEAPGRRERLFLAVPLPEEVRDRIRQGIPRPLPGLRTRPEQWHLTLRFLGDTEPGRKTLLIGEMEGAALGGTFPLRFGGLGAFPRPERARVLWLGIDRGEAELSRLQERVERITRAAGFPHESRPYHPHLTLSRLRPPSPVADLIERAEGPSVPMEVREVVLYRSHLGEGPARHEALRRFPLSADG